MNKEDFERLAIAHPNVPSTQITNGYSQTIAVTPKEEPTNELNMLWKLAEKFAKSDMIPGHFKGKVENCFVVIQMAQRSGIDPMLALQNMYMVSGKPGMSTQLAIALANQSGKLKGPIRYDTKGEGDKMEVTAYATSKEGYELSFTVTMGMAIAEGWIKNPKYKSLPQLMLSYRAAVLLLRLHIPEVLMGMHMADEYEDVAAANGVTVQVEKPIASANELLGLK